MEFSVKKFDLLQELNLTQGVVERKTTIPILWQHSVRSAGQSVTLTATDLELSIRTSCEAKVKKEGSVRFPPRNSWSWCGCCPKARSVSSCSKIIGCKSRRPKEIQDGWHGQGKFPGDSGVSASAGDDSRENPVNTDRARRRLQFPMKNHATRSTARC